MAESGVSRGRRARARLAALAPASTVVCVLASVGWREDVVGAALQRFEFAPFDAMRACSVVALATLLLAAVTLSLTPLGSRSAVAARLPLLVLVPVGLAVALVGQVTAVDGSAGAAFRSLLLWVAVGASPFLVVAALALAAPPSLARDRVVACAAACVTALSALSSAHGTMHFLCFGPSLSPAWLASGVVEAQGFRLWGAATAALVLFVAAARQRGGVRATSIAFGLGALAIAGRDAVTLEAALVVDRALSTFPGEAAPSFDVDALGTLAHLGVAWDGLAGVACGVAVAVALLACLGSRGHRARSFVRATAPVAVVCLWLVGEVSDPPLRVYSTLQAVEPIWSGTGVRPLETTGTLWPAALPANDGETWLVDRMGQIVARHHPAPGVEPWALQIVPDARLRLAALLGLAETADTRVVRVVARARRAVALDALVEGRHRFQFLEGARREVVAVELHLLSHEEIARAYGSAAGKAIPCVQRGLENGRHDACPADTRPVILIDRVPPRATVRDLFASPGAELVLVRHAEPTVTMSPGAGVPRRLPPVSSNLASVAIFSCVLSLLVALVAAVARWRSRLGRGPTRKGTPTPSWLSRRACDLRVEVVTFAGYRDPLDVVVSRTATRLAPALARSVLDAIHGARSRPAVALAVVLVVLVVLRT